MHGAQRSPVFVELPLTCVRVGAFARLYVGGDNGEKKERERGREEEKKEKEAKESKRTKLDAGGGNGSDGRVKRRGTIVHRARSSNL